MTLVEMVAVLLAGTAAGAINTIVGSGTLLTFPTLLAVGLPPVTANVSNNVGLVPGSFSGAWGYRRELAGQRARVLRLLTASVVGGAGGSVLLLVLPGAAFETVVPLLVGLGVALVLLQPWLSRRVSQRAERRETVRRPHGSVGTWLLVGLTGVYGGYFGAAQGVLLMGFLGITLDETMQRLNAVKNVLAGAVNAVAAVIFISVANVSWQAVALIAIGSTVGGLLGARYGRRLPPWGLRGFIAVVGVVAIVVLTVR